MSRQRGASAPALSLEAKEKQGNGYHRGGTQATFNVLTAGHVKWPRADADQAELSRPTSNGSCGTDGLRPRRWKGGAEGRRVRTQVKAIVRALFAQGQPQLSLAFQQTRAGRGGAARRGMHDNGGF